MYMFVYHFDGQNNDVNMLLIIKCGNSQIIIIIIKYVNSQRIIIIIIIKCEYFQTITLFI